MNAFQSMFSFKSLFFALLALLLALVAVIVLPLAQIYLKNDLALSVSSIVLQDLCQDPAILDIRFSLKTAQNIQVQVTQLAVRPRLSTSKTPMATVKFEPDSHLILKSGATDNHLRVGLEIHDPAQLNVFANNALDEKRTALAIEVSLRVSLASWLPFIPIKKTIHYTLDLSELPESDREPPSLKTLGFTEEGHVKLTLYVGVSPMLAKLSFDSTEMNSLRVDARIGESRVSAELVGIHETKQEDLIEVSMIVRAPELEVLDLLGKLVSGDAVDVEVTGSQDSGMKDCRIQQILNDVRIKHRIVESKKKKEEGLGTKMKETWKTLKAQLTS